MAEEHRVAERSPRKGEGAGSSPVSASIDTARLLAAADAVLNYLHGPLEEGEQSQEYVTPQQWDARRRAVAQVIREQIEGR